MSFALKVFFPPQSSLQQVQSPEYCTLHWSELTSSASLYFAGAYGWRRLEIFPEGDTAKAGKKKIIVQYSLSFQFMLKVLPNLNIAYFFLPMFQYLLLKAAVHYKNF